MSQEIQQTIDAIRKVVTEDRVTFIRSRYRKPSHDGEETWYCVVGWMARESGVDDEVLKEAADEPIGVTSIRIGDSEEMMTPIETIAAAVVEHYDGEDPSNFMRFLVDLQKANDRAFSFYVPELDRDREIMRTSFLNKLDDLEERYCGS